MMGKKSRVQYCISQHQRDLVVVRGSLQTTKTRSKKIFLEKSIRNLFVHSLYGSGRLHHVRADCGSRAFFGSH